MLRKISGHIHQLNEWVGQKTAWLTALLVIMVFLDVLAQKLFNYSAAWISEIEWHVFSLIFFLGAGYALRHGRHVRVDLFFENFSKTDKASVNFWGTLLFLIPWCLVVIWFASEYAFESFAINEGSPQPNGLPLWYPIKFAVVIGTLLLLLQGLALLFDSAAILIEERHANKINRNDGH
jgi:TRAP-type mannitol/chloroaromatic compound transport system permease small subunit